MKAHGSCHCGNVKFECEINETKEVVSCNCSICSRKGWLLTFALDTDFKLISGHDSLKDYQFGKKSIHHEFCTNCGTNCFSTGLGHDGKKTRAINVRCLSNFDFKDYTIKEYDGKSI